MRHKLTVLQRSMAQSPSLRLQLQRLRRSLLLLSLGMPHMPQGRSQQR